MKNATFEGLIHEGDELREVNGVPLDHRKPKEILPLLVSLIHLVLSHHFLHVLLPSCLFLSSSTKLPPFSYTFYGDQLLQSGTADVDLHP